MHKDLALPPMPLADPFTRELHQCITRATLEPDLLSQNVAEIRIKLHQFARSAKQNEILRLIERLQQLALGWQQSALVLRQGFFENKTNKKKPIECKLNQTIADIKFCIPQVSATPLKFLKPLLTWLLQYYEKSLAQWNATSESQRLDLMIPIPQLADVNLGFYYLLPEKAREILCRNRYGKIRRKIGMGNHPVAPLKEGLHCKPNPKGMDYISPGIEFAEVSFLESLGGHNVVAATTAFKISHVGIEQIEHGTKNDNEITRQFDEKIKGGHDAEDLLDSNPLLKSQLTIRHETLEGVVVQGGRTIEGESLQRILELMVEFKDLTKRLGKARFVEDLSSFISKQYLQNYRQAKNIPTNDIGDDELLRLLLNKMKNLDLSKRLLDYQDVESDPKKLLEQFKETKNKYTNEEVLAAFALMEKWPELIPGRSLVAVIKLAKLFAMVSRLFGNQLTNAEIIDRVPHLLKLVDLDAFGILYLGSLLTKPYDGKSDNYMVKVLKDARGVVNKLIIVGIDNDKSFGKSIVERKGDHLPGVKCVLNCLFVDVPITEKTRKALLDLSPEFFILEWLKKLYEQNVRYQYLLYLDVITKKGDLIEEGTNQPCLDLPIKLDPTFAPSLYQDIKNLQDYVRKKPDATHGELFELVEPIVSKYYLRILNSSASALDALNKIYYDPPSIEDLLQDLLDVPFEKNAQGQKSLREMLAANKSKENNIEDERTQKIEDTVEQFLTLFTVERDKVWSYLQYLAKSFPCIQKLPFSNDILSSWLHYAIQQSDATTVKLLLRCGANVNHIDDKGRTCLHLAVLVVPHSPEVIKILMNFPEIKLNAYDKEKWPPLFYVDSENEALFNTLVENGIDLECYSDDDRKETLLDRAIREDNPEYFFQLVSKGAGRRVNPETAYSYLKKLRSSPELKDKLKNATNALCRKNPRLAWLLSLEGTSEVNRNIFPEFPLLEEEISSLCHLIFNESCFAETRLSFVRNSNQQITPVLLTQQIKGENLNEIFKDPVKLELLRELLDEGNFTILFLMSLLLNLEDGRPNKYIVEPYINEQGVRKYRIISSGNDRALIRVGLRKDELGVKNAINCLDAMLQSLDPKKVKLFLSHDPAQILEKWLIGAIAKQKNCDQFVSVEDKKRLLVNKEHPVVLSLPFAPEVLADIYEKFMTVQDKLRNQPDITALELLQKVMPLLGNEHDQAFKKYEDPRGRFKYLFTKKFSMCMPDHYEPLINAQGFLQLANIPEDAVIVSQPKYNAQGALAELKLVKLEKQQLSHVTSELKKGNYVPFRSLLLKSSYDAVVKGFKLSEMTVSQQKIILEAFKGMPLQKLDLSNCKIVDDKILRELLTSCESLLELNMSGCAEISPTSLGVVVQECPALEILDLSGLPKLQAINLSLPQLRCLNANDCTNLVELQLNAPKLKSVKADRCKLIKFEIENLLLPYFEQFSCENNPQLPQEQIEKLFAKSPLLLQNLKSTYLANPHLLTWFSQAYGSHAWSKELVTTMIRDNKLDLSGIALTETDLTAILQQCNKTNVAFELDCRGDPVLGIRGWLAVINSIRNINSVKVTDYTCKEVPSKILQEPDAVTMAAVGLKDELFCTSGDRGNISQWSPGFDKKDKVLQGHTRGIISRLFLPNGNLVTGSFDRTIKIWDCTTGACIQTLNGHAEPVTALAYNQNLLISGSQDHTIRIWNIHTTQPELCAKTISLPFETVKALEILPNKQGFICASKDGALYFYNMSGKVIKTVKITDSEILALKWMSEHRLAIACSDNTIHIWNNKGKEEVIRTLTGHTGHVLALECLVSDFLLASASLDKTVKIWDILTGKCLQTLLGHNEGVSALTLQSQGQLISAAEDGSIRQWNFPAKIISLAELRQWQGKFELFVKKDRIIIRTNVANQAGLESINKLLETVIGKDSFSVTHNPQLTEYHYSSNLPMKKFALEQILPAIARGIINSTPSAVVSPWNMNDMPARRERAPTVFKFFRSATALPGPSSVGSSGKFLSSGKQEMQTLTLTKATASSPKSDTTKRVILGSRP